MEGPLLFHLQVLLAAVLQVRGGKMEGESINGTNAPKAVPKTFPSSGRTAAAACPTLRWVEWWPAGRNCFFVNQSISLGPQ